MKTILKAKDQAGSILMFDFKKENEKANLSKRNVEKKILPWLSITHKCETIR